MNKVLIRFLVRFLGKKASRNVFKLSYVHFKLCTHIFKNLSQIFIYFGHRKNEKTKTKNGGCSIHLCAQLNQCDVKQSAITYYRNGGLSLLFSLNHQASADMGSRVFIWLKPVGDESICVISPVCTNKKIQWQQTSR